LPTFHTPSKLAEISKGLIRLRFDSFGHGFTLCLVLSFCDVSSFDGWCPYPLVFSICKMVILYHLFFICWLEWLNKEIYASPLSDSELLSSRNYAGEKSLINTWFVHFLYHFPS
jgi:hypothetical protein